MKQERAAFDILSAARRVGAHPDTLRRAISRQELRAEKVFGKWRVSALDLGAWLARRTEKASP